MTLDTKRGNGKYIATYAPYGYVKSQEDKHKLVVDEFASQIVKRIFKSSCLENLCIKLQKD